MRGAARPLPEVERDLDAIVIPAIADDGSLYRIGKLEAHRLGARHLAVSVFVFSGDRLLIQRRADHKYHCGGQWANTCCTHPHWGELPERCAQRRLFEEVGLQPPLEPRAVVEYRADVGNGLIEHERVHVFRGTLPDASDRSPDSTSTRCRICAGSTPSRAGRGGRRRAGALHALAAHLSPALGRARPALSATFRIN